MNNRSLRWTALCIAICTSFALPQTTDVFPLVRGARYTYQHENHRSSWTEWWTSWGSDSGLVAYQVMDSARVNDTTIAWTIRESRAVIVRSGSQPGRDTTYSRTDSGFVTLTEITTGRHELRCSSDYVWQFPRSPECPVFRFSDSANTLVHYDFPGCHNIVLAGNYDSLWLSQDSGLTGREYSLCFELYESGNHDWRSSKLLTRIMVSVDEETKLPSRFALLQNYPNPFNPSTRIRFVIPVGTSRQVGTVSLRVYDVIGREVATLVNEVKAPGEYTVPFDASGLASGVYLYRLQTGAGSQVRKMVLMQ